MKKVMKQSTLISILNASCLFLLICGAISFFFLYLMSGKIAQANIARHGLTENAILFTDASSY
ncbi:MAG: hypothetical protein QM793_10475 [Muricomes sp.]